MEYIAWWWPPGRWGNCGGQVALSIYYALSSFSSQGSRPCVRHPYVRISLPGDVISETITRISQMSLESSGFTLLSRVRASPSGNVLLQYSSAKVFTVTCHESDTNP
jgi:hypothetical protein